jgi:hypothetical protein
MKSITSKVIKAMLEQESKQHGPWVHLAYLGDMMQDRGSGSTEAWGLMLQESRLEKNPGQTVRPA